MSDKFYVGRDLISFSDNGKYKPVSRITLKLDDENVVTAGDDTGFELVADCPFATQEMADALLAQYQGYVYQAYEAGAVNIDPAAELGDGLTADGHYSVISRTSDNGSGYPTVSAPGEAELDDEYPSAGPMTQEFNRKVAEAYSRISKTAEEIRLEVVKKIDEDAANTLISAAIGKIELSVSSKDGSTSFTLTDGEAEISAQTLDLTVDAVNVKGKLTADQIDASELKVDAANVTGSLTIGQLPDDVAVQDDIPYFISDLYDDSDFVNETGVVSIIDGTVTADYINALGVSAQYLQGKYVYLLDASETIAGRITVSDAETADYAIDISSYSGLRLLADAGMYFENGYSTFIMMGDEYITLGLGDVQSSNAGYYSCGTASFYWSDVYSENALIEVSDRNKKTDIVYGLDEYDAVFDGLMPVSFLFKTGASGRRHPGLIAQDVEELLAKLGIDTKDFSPFVKAPRKDNDGNVIEGEYEYALRYGEFIALLIEQVQKLKKRVTALEVVS